MSQITFAVVFGVIAVVILLAIGITNLVVARALMASNRALLANDQALLTGNQALRDELWDVGLRVDMLDMAMNRRRNPIRDINQLEPAYTMNNAPSTQEYYRNYGVINNNYIRNVMPCPCNGAYHSNV